MFGSSSPFGQSSSASFGSQSPFGQNTASNNPFAPKPFGAANPFGSQTGGSMFGSTSTGVFGQSSAPMSSTPVFGAASSPAFGTSNPTFGGSSSSFGGSSAFAQKPAFGNFGSGTQTSPFGSSFQQSQPSFGSNLFGASSNTSPFGASSQPAFGGSSSPAFGTSSTPFGASSTPAFGATSAPAFGSTPSPAFGNTGSAFGVSSSPAFGGSGGAFGSTSTSGFGAGSTPAFGTSTGGVFGATGASAFGATSAPTFGATPSTPAFGNTPSNPAFGAAPSSTPSFSFNSNSAFGQTTSNFGSTGFGSTPSSFGASTSPFGASTSTTYGGGFGQPNVGGSRVAPYTQTPEVDGTSSNQPTAKLDSISAMPVYKEKSHEELRWEDYQRGDKGGPAPAGQSTPGANFGGMSTAQASPFGTQAFGQTSSSPFSTSVQPNPFAPKPAGFGATSTSTFSSSPFGSITASPNFGSTAAPTPSLFGASTQGFGSGSASSLFSTGSSSAMGSAPLFGSAPAQVSSTGFGSSLNFGNPQPSLFQSSSSLGTATGFGQSSSSLGQSPGQNMFNNTPSTFGSNLFSNSTGSQFGFGQSTPSLSAPFQPSLPTQTGSAFNLSNFGQAPSAGSSGLAGASMFGQALGQPSANQISAVAQPVAVTNPFGTLPAMPHMSIGNNGASPSIQYGISSMPVVDKPIPVRVSSFLTSRHLSQRRIRLPARKYHPKNDGSRVPFFSDDDEAPSTPKADALFVPRENPRALIIRPIDQWPKSSMKESCVFVHENGETSKENGHPSNGSFAEGNGCIANGNGLIKEQNQPVKINQKSGAVADDASNHKGDSYITLSGHRAGEAAIVYEHGADIEAMMPKLRHSDYYTEPRIQELAAKERAEPGFCKRVKDFVVGRHGYGSIRFLGETDIRRLDLESLVQFNNREVIVYLDDSKKPPVGQGLNKPAEVTLLNIKCYDKKTGKQILEGPRIEKYKEMLKKKAEDQDAEFLSYDPEKGEWKFRVSHFSKYVFNDDDDDDDQCGSC